MTDTTFFIDKRTGTSADTHLAAGFARLVREIVSNLGWPDTAREVLLRDQGSHYQVILGQPLRPEDVDQLSAPLDFIRHLDTESQKPALGAHFGAGFAYDVQRGLRDAYREKLKQLPTAARTPDARLAGHPALAELHATITPPDSRLPLYLAINQMKVASSFNEPVIRWRELGIEHQRALIALLLRLFSQRPNPLADVISEWEQRAKQHDLGKTRMTMLQVINPTTGKGANRSKANALTIGGQEEFWALELLKFAGYFMLAHPQVILDSKDRKTYVLRPRQIELSFLDQVMQTFRDVLWSSTPAKMDVLALLRFAQVLVERDRQALLREQTAGRRRYRSTRPADLVHGFDVTFYKDMGSAYAVMNIGVLNLPAWVPAIERLDEADRVSRVLAEHLNVVRSIQSRDGAERAAEYDLLQAYRDFLSSRSIEPFLDFAARFAPYLSQKIERNEFTARFSVATLEELIAMTDTNERKLGEILAKPGFHNIASAVRASTVSLQYRKGRGQSPGFEIRYGLAQELIRRSNYPDEFLAALSDFITRYNTETAQKYETSKGSLRRRRISEQDVTDVVELLDSGHSSKTIARLLVAFGSAKSSAERPDPQGDSESLTASENNS